MKMPEGFKLSFSFLENQKDIWIWLVKYGAVITVFLFFFLPISSRLSSNIAEHNSLKKQISDLKEITTNLLSPEEVARVKERVDRFEQRLADESKTNAILDQVTKIAEENHLKMIQIYSDSPVLVKNEQGQDLEVGGKKLNILPVTFRVEADYKSLANFLRAMSEQATWTYMVEGLQLQESSTEAGSLQCDVTLSYITR